MNDFSFLVFFLIPSMAIENEQDFLEFPMVPPRVFQGIIVFHNCQ